MTMSGGDSSASIESVSIPSRLSVFRVFGLVHEFTDRPDVQTAETAAGPVRGDRLRVTVGDVPEDLIRCVQARIGWANFILDSRYGGRHNGLTADELEDVFEQGKEAREKVVADLRGRFHTWITLEVYRSLDVEGYAPRTHRWLHSASETVVPRIREFSDEAAPFLDIAAVRLLPALRDRLQPSGTTYRSRQAYLLTPGRTPICVPTFSGRADLKVTSPWETVPWPDVEAAVATLGYESQNVRLLRTPARWLWAALGERSDDLRRFQFAFLGLEVLTHKVGKRLESLSEVHVPEDEQGLEARFARVALHFDAQATWADVARFRRLVKKRNDLAHGRSTDEDLTTLPANEAVWMLRDYLSSVAAAEATGTLP